MATPLLLYGSKTWLNTKRIQNKIQSAEITFLRRTNGCTRSDRFRNEDIREELHIFSMNGRIKEHRDRWFQHINRMQDNRLPKLLLNYKATGRRDVGRPKGRWRDKLRSRNRQYCLLRVVKMKMMMMMMSVLALDPAIQQVTTNTSNAQRGLEDYNPFADQGEQRPTAVRGAANPPQYQTMPTMPIAQPAIMQPTQEAPPPPYTKSGQQQQPQQQQQQQQQFTTAEFQRRQEELERKAQELARREEELKNAPYNARRNNWPPLPEKFCFQPCFYQDINVDIPLEFQKIVRLLYYLWMFHACVMVLNVFGGMTLMINSADFTTFGLAILYLILFTPFSFLCWYRPAYKAFR
ncbi:hypothetical protein ANN_16271 [Periplaneta americana]|uniref:Secretory carrier-associated membrane protein n=1 Tax=Periplaneta americana TaxID=6978 RepID=A0ABQ8SJQ2_PERAM|nr:hypothetical protein ANN_16271 [Periplaneta americana]